ncbi:MAG: beta-CASP ribonuclease aCPSF1 [Thermoproteota archaeon]|nr:MAG: beta-CASP ribonuclease aCPSF1 [Candidatus Korarchaeota archaeon]
MQETLRGQHLPADQIKRVVKRELQRLGKNGENVKKVDLEGPFIVVYAADPAVLVGTPELAELARTLKKKIVVLSEKPKLESESEAIAKIKELVPERAEIVDVIFVKETREVYIMAKRTGYVVGKAGSKLTEILRETGWKPVVIRAPTMQSTFLETLQRLLVGGAVERKRNMRRMALRIYREPLGLRRGIYITFLGGAREVGRSSVMVSTGESSVLLDAGIGVGSGEFFPRYDSPDFDLDNIDAVIVTHAHLDHAGALPLLYKYGYRGPVYVTRPTRDLIALLLYDYMNLSKRTGSIPFFSEREVRLLLNHMITLNYGETVDISPDIKLTFYNAGHILGSALAHLNIVSHRHNILYTGDFRFRNTRLLNRAVSKFPKLETLIMECTYGGEKDVIPPLADAEGQLISLIEETIGSGGKVLIPALSVGRAQEILLTLVKAFGEGRLPDVPVYIDGMIYDATAIHTAYPDYLSNYVREKVFKEDEDPFTEPHISPVRSPDEREAVIEGGPSIILAPSGMLEGGPSVEYFRRLAGDPKNAVILVSYQPEGTLGRRVRDGARRVEILSNSGVEVVEIRALVASVEGFSAHADKVQLLSYLNVVNPRPRTVFLVHGEPKKISAFHSLAARSIRGVRVISPHILERIKVA